MTARDCSSTDIRSLLLRELKPALPASDTSVLPFRKKLNKSLAMHHVNRVYNAMRVQCVP